MSSLRNAVKSKHVHRERHQPLSRKHLGPLEKKKDYKKRAQDQNEKNNVLKTLRKRALNKNPDEFDYHMINSETKAGVHHEIVKDEELTVSDVAEDLTYVTHRRSLERKKIEKLKAQLHILDSEQPRNSHIIFVDTEEEAKKADPAKLLDTHPALLNRTFNRLRKSQLAKGIGSLKKTGSLQELSVQKKKAYKELSRRIEREEKLRILQEKLEVRKKIMASSKKGKDKMPKLVKEGTATTAPVYKWPQERQK
ncbi:putative U3 small nucleolar RNA-associated protein 11 [Oratosquilla oratoria]|uniref:putative U3 small nucleolar RNA-associated protein 11 n=1 Tax=Oratosquilla oratoria TaxID=337810 RepID=UPI003F766994